MLTTYEIVDGRIRCNICRRSSNHPHDIEYKYCAACRFGHREAEFGLAWIKAGLAMVAPWLSPEDVERSINAMLATIKIETGGDDVVQSDG